MANTTAINGRFIQITGLDADWLYSSDLPVALQSGLSVKSIQFNPSAASDVMVINEGGINGASIFHVKCTGDTDQRIKYFNPPTRMQPVIDISDCTLGTAANAKVIIEIG